MLPKGARSFGVTVNLAIGKEKARCWRNEVYAEDRVHPLLPLGRLANLLDTKILDTKFVWENGEAMMQCRDKGQWCRMTKFEIRNNMAYADMICKSNAIRSVAQGLMGPTSQTSDNVQLALLGESSTR